MSFNKPARLATRSVRKSSVPYRARPAERARTSRVFVERLEERCMLSLLGLSQLATKPDIASGSRSNSPTRRSATTPTRSSTRYPACRSRCPTAPTDAITNQTNKTAAKTTLSLDLDNFGYFVSGGTSPDFSINGHVVSEWHDLRRQPADGPGPGIRLLGHDHHGRSPSSTSG